MSIFKTVNIFIDIVDSFHIMYKTVFQLCQIIRTNLITKMYFVVSFLCICNISSNKISFYENNFHTNYFKITMNSISQLLEKFKETLCIIHFLATKSKMSLFEENNEDCLLTVPMIRKLVQQSISLKQYRFNLGSTQG